MIFLKKNVIMSLLNLSGALVTGRCSREVKPELLVRFRGQAVLPTNLPSIAITTYY